MPAMLYSRVLAGCRRDIDGTAVRFVDYYGMLTRVFCVLFKFWYRRIGQRKM